MRARCFDIDKWVTVRRSNDVVGMSKVTPVQPAQLKHVLALDGLRGVAILLVLILHFVSSGLGPLRRVAGAGWVGVDLFFVLSGFLITRILLAAISSPRFFRNFYARRALRIWPLYYIVLAFAFGLTRLLPEPLHIETSLFPFYATFTQNLKEQFSAGPWALAVTWSLAIEEQFYVVWPLCVRLLDRRILVTLLVGLLLTEPVLRFIALSRGASPYSVYVSTWFRVDTVGAGALAAIASQSSVRATIERLSRPILVIALASAGILCVTLFEGDRLILSGGPISGMRALVFSLMFSILAVGFSALVVHAASGAPSVLRRVLSIPGLRYLGRISFGLYLLQGIVITLSQTLFRGWLASSTGLSHRSLSLVVVVSALASTFVLAEISWRLLESRVLALRRYFSETGTVSTTGAVGYTPQSNG
jgi:peptidoglycan/LPS O-acetylase OafA/YrhL